MPYLLTISTDRPVCRCDLPDLPRPTSYYTTFQPSSLRSFSLSFTSRPIERAHWHPHLHCPLFWITLTMTKVSLSPKTALPYKHSQAKEEDEEEEDDMASHLAEDPVRPGPLFAYSSTNMDLMLILSSSPRLARLVFLIVATPSIPLHSNRFWRWTTMKMSESSPRVLSTDSSNKRRPRSRRWMLHCELIPVSIVTAHSQFLSHP